MFKRIIQYVCIMYIAYLHWPLVYNCCFYFSPYLFTGPMKKSLLVLLLQISSCEGKLYTWPIYTLFLYLICVEHLLWTNYFVFGICTCVQIWLVCSVTSFLGGHILILLGTNVNLDKMECHTQESCWKPKGLISEILSK